MAIATSVRAAIRRARVLALAGVIPALLGAQRQASLPLQTCAANAFVPPLAPDTVAETLLDSLGTVETPSRPGMRYMRDLLAARFDSSASQEQRQAAVDRVCGTVVGGDRSDGDDGYYLVRLHGAESVGALDAAADMMRHMPGVRSAQTLALRHADGAAAPPAGSASAVCADGSSGGLVRVEALKEMIASREPDEVRLVNGLGLGGVDTSAVHMVGDGVVCGRVAAAIKEGASFSLRDTPFLVLRAGPRYVAFDPRGVDRSFFVVDTGFVFRTVLR